MLSDKNCYWTCIVNSWHVGWSSFTCPSHMLCGLVKFETHRKQQGLFLELLHLFIWGSFSTQNDSFVVLVWGFFFFLSSRISWCKSELKTVYYHLVDVVL